VFIAISTSHFRHYFDTFRSINKISSKIEAKCTTKPIMALEVFKDDKNVMNPKGPVKDLRIFESEI
jgi:hypothetical protein